MMLIEYIKERYGNELKDRDQLIKASFDYLRQMESEGFTAYTTQNGFVTYRFAGDACILNDLYVAPQARGTGRAWELFNTIILKSRKAGKSVIISFSDHIGQNHEHGLGAMKAAGFSKAFDTSQNQVFIRGV